MCVFQCVHDLFNVATRYAKRGITLKPWHDERFNPKETTISSRVPEYNGYGAPNIQDEFALGLALEVGYRLMKEYMSEKN
jgi:hypothetical protein